jgi:hypothetical protein
MSPTKRKPLDTAALAAASVAQPDAAQLATATLIVAPPKTEQWRASRVGKVAIQGDFPEETRRELKMLAVRQDRTVEDLLGEAVADVLRKYAATTN